MTAFYRKSITPGSQPLRPSVRAGAPPLGRGGQTPKPPTDPKTGGARNGASRLRREDPKWRMTPRGLAARRTCASTYSVRYGRFATGRCGQRPLRGGCFVVAHDHMRQHVCACDTRAHFRQPAKLLTYPKTGNAHNSAARRVDVVIDPYGIGAAPVRTDHVRNTPAPSPPNADAHLAP